MEKVSKKAIFISCPTDEENMMFSIEQKDDKYIFEKVKSKKIPDMQTKKGEKEYYQEQFAFDPKTTDGTNYIILTKKEEQIYITLGIMEKINFLLCDFRYLFENRDKFLENNIDKKKDKNKKDKEKLEKENNKNIQTIYFENNHTQTPIKIIDIDGFEEVIIQKQKNEKNKYQAKIDVDSKFLALEYRQIDDNKTLACGMFNFEKIQDTQNEIRYEIHMKKEDSRRINLNELEQRILTGHSVEIPIIQ